MGRSHRFDAEWEERMLKRVYIVYLFTPALYLQSTKTVNRSGVIEVRVVIILVGEKQRWVSNVN